MDPLRKDDIERARRTPLAERARQALEAARLGIHLRRAGIRARRPAASEDDVDRELREWLEREH